MGGFSKTSISAEKLNFCISYFRTTLSLIGSSEDTAPLVPKHIYLDDYLKRLTLTEGENFVMPCFQYGANLVSYKFNERVLAENPKDGLLIINSVSKHNEGMYTCEILPATAEDSVKRVFLKIGEAESTTVEDVNSSPIDENSEVYVTLGEHGSATGTVGIEEAAPYDPSGSSGKFFGNLLVVLVGVLLV